MMFPLRFCLETPYPILCRVGMYIILGFGLTMALYLLLKPKKNNF